jgi:hypothetical protein
MVRLLAFVLPLGLDSFAVAAALGAAGLTGAWDRLRVSLVFVAFEAGMPLVGLAAGGGIAQAIGGIADYLAAAGGPAQRVSAVLRRPWPGPVHAAPASGTPPGSRAPPATPAAAPRVWAPSRP